MESRIIREIDFTIQDDKYRLLCLLDRKKDDCINFMLKKTHPVSEAFYENISSFEHLRGMQRKDNFVLSDFLDNLAICLPVSPLIVFEFGECNLSCSNQDITFTIVLSLSEEVDMFDRLNQELDEFIIDKASFCKRYQDIEKKLEMISNMKDNMQKKSKDNFLCESADFNSIIKNKGDEYIKEAKELVCNDKTSELSKAIDEMSSKITILESKLSNTESREYNVKFGSDPIKDQKQSKQINVSNILVKPTKYLQFGLKGKITSMCFMKGSYMAFGDEYGRAYIFNSNKNKGHMIKYNKAGGIDSMCYRNNKLFMTDFREITVWKIECKDNEYISSEPIHTITLNEKIFCLYVNDKSIFATQGNSISVFDIEHFSLMQELDDHLENVNAIVGIPESDDIVSGGEDNIIIARTFNQLGESTSSFYVGHMAGIISLACNKDKIYSSAKDFSLRIWCIKTCQCLNVISMEKDKICINSIFYKNYRIYTCHGSPRIDERDSENGKLTESKIQDRNIIGICGFSNNLYLATDKGNIQVLQLK